MSYQIASVGLENLTSSGKPPETRIKDSASAFEIVSKLVRADQTRNFTRAKLRGLVDGNPPYSGDELRRNGQAFRTNVNFREAEAFLAMAMSAFYDVFAEVSTYATVECKYGRDIDKQVEWGKVLTEEFDRLQKMDPDFDYLMQLSQREMVLLGTGPFVFEDTTNWKCKALKSVDVLVPDDTKSNVRDWKVCAIQTRVTVDELWQKIKDGQAAEAAGWDVQVARKAIMDAAPEEYRNRASYDWEFYQEQLRGNDLYFSTRCDVVRLTHIFYVEFDGQISHRIVNEREPDGGFVFSKLNRFSNWEQVIHPMYYDRGDGQHHGVKGLGIKMFQAMELKNRLRCAMVDSAFARTQVLFKPLNANALSKMSVIQLGPYAVVPPDYDVVQQNVAGVMDAPMAVNADLEGVLQGNLSQYRQSLNKPQGNPRTATEIQAIMSQQSALGKTQLNRYYQQLDGFFAERYRRAANPNLDGGTESNRQAIEFQKRCESRGVPKVAIRTVEVKATRTIGQGSAFVKQMLLQELLGVSTMLPESGKVSLLEDYIAAKVGQQMVGRYVPTGAPNNKMQDQMALANMEHASIRLGNPAVVTDTQNHVVHLTVHLAAANEAAASIQQGANPSDVYAFLQGILIHSQDHLVRIAQDPTRGAEAQAFQQQLQQLTSVLGQLENLIKEQQANQANMQRAQAIQQGMDPKTQVLMAATQARIQRENMDTMADIQRSQMKAQAEVQRRNAEAAAGIIIDEQNARANK